jgi:predicted DNA-binding transcriptional regulator AlpA
MSTLLRFRDLQARGIATSWTQLKRLIQEYGFPPGRMLSPNVRVWDEEEEVDPWLASRPVEGPEPRGAAKAKRDRKRKAARDNASAETTAAT